MKMRVQRFTHLVNTLHHHNPNWVCCVCRAFYASMCVCVCVPYMQASRQKYIRCVFFFLFQTICGSNKPIPYFVVVVVLPDYMSQKSQSPFGKACDLPLLFPPALCLRFYFCCLLRSICVWWQMPCPLWVLSFIAMLSMQMTTCLRIFLRQMWQKFMVFSVLKEYGKCSLGMASHHRYSIREMENFLRFSLYSAWHVREALIFVVSACLHSHSVRCLQLDDKLLQILTGSRDVHNILLSSIKSPWETQWLLQSLFATFIGHLHIKTSFMSVTEHHWMVRNDPTDKQQMEYCLRHFTIYNIPSHIIRIKKS